MEEATRPELPDMTDVFPEDLTTELMNRVARPLLVDDPVELARIEELEEVSAQISMETGELEPKITLPSDPDYSASASRLDLLEGPTLSELDSIEQERQAAGIERLMHAIDRAATPEEPAIELGVSSPYED